MKCKCGCGQEVKEGNMFIYGHQRRGKIPWNKGISPSRETKKKQREVKLGENNPMFGRNHSTESKQRIGEGQNTPKIRQKKREANSHRVFSEEGIKKLSESKLGENNPMYGKEGTWLGKHHTIESKQKQSEIKLGELNPNWKDGASYEPYCSLFNEEFKERVREFFDRKCVLCGTPENGRKLCVHHVNYNKDTCCDNSKPLFVSLCTSCHAKTNFDREYYKNFFTKLIVEKYNGECFTKK